MASIVLFVTVGILVTLNFIEFFLQKIDNAQIGQSDIIQDKYDMDLFELNYRFAVQQIEPEIGTITLSSVTIDSQDNKTIEAIEMIDCNELVKDKNWKGFFDNNQIKFRLNKGDDLLCPNIENLRVEGQYGDETFTYIKLSVVACNTTERDDC